MRAIFVLSLLLSPLAFGDIKIDKAFWQKSTEDIAANCNSSRELAAACIRGLNLVLNDILDSRSYLLFRQQLSDLWTASLDSEGKPKFEQGDLVIAELTPKGLLQLNQIKALSYAGYVRFFRDIDQRYDNMSGSNLVSTEDFQAAFRWVFEHTRDDEHARSLYAEFVTGQLRELYRDPHASLQLRKPKSPTSSRAPVAFANLNGRRVVARVRPGSAADSTGLTVGMVLDQVGGLKLTEANSSERVSAFTKQSAAAVFLDSKGQAKTISPWEPEPPLPGIHNYSFPFNGSRLGVLEIYSFSVMDICRSAEIAIRKLQEEPLRGLIVDLRGNPGGDTSAARCIAGLLFGEGIYIAEMRNLTSEGISYNVLSTHKKVTGKYPVTFLIDAASASASELLAGAAQDLKLAWLVGQRSFGKGVAQSRDPAHLKNQQLEDVDMIRTHFRFHFPSGFSPQVVGLKPDFLAPSPIEGVNFDVIAARIEDLYGRLFEAPQQKLAPDKPRTKLHKKVQDCVTKVEKRFQPPANESVRRWLEDRQLRRASEVTVCAALISANSR